MMSFTSPHYFLEENKNILITKIGMSFNGFCSTFLRHVKEDKKVKTALVHFTDLNNKKLFIDILGKENLFKKTYTFMEVENGYQYIPLTVENIEKYMKNDYFNGIPKYLEYDLQSNFKIILETLEKYQKEEYFDITGKEYGVEKPSEDDLMLLEINGYAL